MDKRKRSGIRRNVIVIVSVAAVIFLGAGTVLGLWSAREMREQVGDQFNEQQLVIARNITDLIERELHLIKKEMLLLSKEVSLEGLRPEDYYESIQKSFFRVLESGVWRIEIVELANRMAYVYMPYKHYTTDKAPGIPLDALPITEMLEEKSVWVSQPQIKRSGIGLILALSLAGDSPRLLVFNVNVSWFLTPFLKNIRSGKTGYAWIIDGNGNFLFHSDADFVGKSAFKAREEKNPNLSYEKINFIQKEKMLKGQAGTGWYFSGWHRGITGRIKKLIAYCPIIVSDNPPQKWSVAVVAPVSEIEGAVHKGHLRQFLLQGLILLVILLGASAVLFFEIRWSRVMEKKVAQRTEDLKKSEEKYRSLVESAEDFIFTVDSEGIFQSMNSFTANFFGGPPEKFLNKGLSSLFPDKVAEKQLKLVGLVYKLGKSVRDEFELKTGEHEIWISANFMPLKDEEGEVNAVLCIARDITESKKLEKQLVNTEKLASMGTLAAGVAHEINNPLGFIRSNLGILGEYISDLCELAKEYNFLEKTFYASENDYPTAKEIEPIFQKINAVKKQIDLDFILSDTTHIVSESKDGADRIKKIVSDLKEFASIDQPGKTRADINACIDSALNILAHVFEGKAKIVKDYSELPAITCYRDKMNQVFMNLLLNAADAIKDQGTITITTRAHKNDNPYVEISIADTGVGILPENLNCVFEPFFTTKDIGNGMGLGLSTSYDTIKSHGGTLNVESQSGRGSIFTIKIPVRD